MERADRCRDRRAEVDVAEPEDEIARVEHDAADVLDVDTQFRPGLWQMVGQEHITAPDEFFERRTRLIECKR